MLKTLHCNNTGNEGYSYSYSYRPFLVILVTLILLFSLNDARPTIISLLKSYLGFKQEQNTAKSHIPLFLCVCV